MEKLCPQDDTAGCAEAGRDPRGSDCGQHSARPVWWRLQRSGVGHSLGAPPLAGWFPGYRSATLRPASSPGKRRSPCLQADASRRVRSAFPASAPPPPHMHGDGVAERPRGVLSLLEQTQKQSARAVCCNPAGPVSVPQSERVCASGLGAFALAVPPPGVLFPDTPHVHPQAFPSCLSPRPGFGFRSIS